MLGEVLEEGIKAERKELQKVLFFEVERRGDRERVGKRNRLESSIDGWALNLCFTSNHKE